MDAVVHSESVSREVAVLVEQPLCLRRRGSVAHQIAVRTW